MVNNSHLNRKKIVIFFVKLCLKHLRIGRNQKRLKLAHSWAGANHTCYKLHGKKPLHIFTEFLTNTMLFRIENCEGISIISAWENPLWTLSNLNSGSSSAWTIFFHFPIWMFPQRGKQFSIYHCLKSFIPSIT